jgi:hypothetical protein
MKGAANRSARAKQVFNHPYRSSVRKPPSKPGTSQVFSHSIKANPTDPPSFYPTFYDRIKVIKTESNRIKPSHPQTIFPAQMRERGSVSRSNTRQCRIQEIFSRIAKFERLRATGPRSDLFLTHCYVLT